MIELKSILDPDSLRKRYARVNVYDARTELSYQAQRSGASMVIRKVADLGAQMVEGSADMLGSVITETVGSFFKFFLGPQIASNLGMFAGAAIGKLAGVIGVGVAAGVSAGFAQMDFVHQKSNLRTLYADELAAKLHKSADSVTVNDMEALAKENPVLNQELDRAKRQRNFAIPLAIVATLAAFGTVAAVMSLPALVGIAGVGGFLIKAAISMAAYTAVKMPLQMLGNRLFGLQDETVNDNIVDVKRMHEKGIAVTPQDLLPVFVKTDVKLDAQIVLEFGQHYEKLPEEKQKQAVLKACKLVPLEKLADDINSGAINATELLFASIGEHSGVARKDVIDVPFAANPAQPAHGAKSFQDKLASTRRDPKRPFTERIVPELAGETVVTF